MVTTIHNRNSSTQIIHKTHPKNGSQSQCIAVWTPLGTKSDSPRWKLSLSGKVAASVFEFPNCRVEAETRETALSQIRAIFLERLQHIEAIVWSVPIPASKPAWDKICWCL